MNKRPQKLTHQTLTHSRFLGQLAYAEGKPSVPDQDDRMLPVLTATRDNHVELMDHIRAWSSGWHDALKIQNEITISERPLDLRSIKREPDEAPKSRPFRFRRH